LNIAENENSIHLGARQIQQLFVVFLNNKPVAGLAEHRALLGDVEIGHLPAFLAL